MVRTASDILTGQETRSRFLLSTAMFNTPSALGYGVADSDIGPLNEPSETVGTQATTATISSVLSAASPGDVILLRAGTYSGNETIPAGSSGNPIVVKAYAQEPVSITGLWTFNSYVVLAGVRIDRSFADQYAIFINKDSAGAITDVVVRYCDIYGGSTDCVRFRGNVTNSRIHHCRIDGGKVGHNYDALKGATTSFVPSNIELDHNLFTKDYLEYGDLVGERVPGSHESPEDLIDLQGWGDHNIHHNTFSHNQGENAIDLKPPTTGSPTCLIEDNYFDGATIYKECITEQSGYEDVQIRRNLFDGVRPGSDTVGGHLTIQDSKAIIEDNILRNCDNNGVVSKRAIWLTPAANGVKVRNNYVQGTGLIRFQGSPTNITWDGNRFEDLTMSEDTPVFTSSVNNELSNVSGDWSSIGTGIASYPNPTGDPSYVYATFGVNPSMVGPSASTPETTGTQATTSTYQSVIAAASPGDVVLLRAGTYTAGLTVPNGTVGSYITIKPYNGESVTVSGDWQPGNYVIFDGITFRHPTRLASVLIQNTSATAIHDFKYLYCSMRDGGTEAVRIAGNVTDWEIGYCYLDGGDKRHSMKTHYQVGGADSGYAPANFNIHHCEITHILRGNSSLVPGEGDLLQIEGFNGINYIEYNYFHDEPHENALDIKPPHGSGNSTLYVRYNYFDHDTIANAALLDQSDGGPAVSNTIIHHNFFPGSTVGAVVSLGGDFEVDGYTDFQWNLIPHAPGRIAFWNLTNAVFAHNFIGPADMQFDNSSGTRPVSGLTLNYNRFVDTDLNDQAPGGSGYSGVNNEKVRVTGGADWNPIVAGRGEYPLPPGVLT